MTHTDLLAALPPETRMRAKLIASHLLLANGSLVLDMECETGALTAALAYFCPRLNFVGIDRNRKFIELAQRRFEAYGLNNLSFEVADSMAIPRADNSVDAIVNSRVVGAIYTRNTYNEAPVISTLADHFRLLKPEGIMVMYDYPMPAPDAYVHMEFPVPKRDPRHFRLYGTPIGITQGEREIELLQWFSKNARARDAVKGFYLEEVPPQVPYTRLFRLPAKWAYEFTIRKQNPQKFKAKIGHEFTCFTEADYDRVLNRILGARLLYSAPWRNPHTIKTHFEGSFRLYNNEGKIIGFPPTGYVMVAQKVQAGQTLHVSELRPAGHTASSLAIQSVRHEETGQILDLVSRADPRIDILPYTMDDEGLIQIVMQPCVQKELMNLSPHQVRNLDGKRWSGHLLSALTLSVHDIEAFDCKNQGQVARLMMDRFGLLVEQGAIFEDGPRGYPAPDMIDEYQTTWFIKIKTPDFSKPKARGLRLYYADDILRATGSGFLPSAWLDIQVQSLLRSQGQTLLPWLHESVSLGQEPPPADQMLKAKAFLKQKPKAPDASPQKDIWVTGGKNTKWPRVAGKYKPVRGNQGTITTKCSTFIEQGQIDGVSRGLAAHDVEYASPHNDRMNMAVIMPLTADMSGTTLMGFELKEMPVPSRYGQTDPVMNLPTIALPPDITTVDEARAFVATSFEVSLERVAPMGESFYTMVDMMPQRVFPFAITRVPYNKKAHWIYAPLEHLWQVIDTDFSDSILWKWGLSNAFLCQESQQSQGFDPRLEARARRYGLQVPKHSSQNVPQKTTTHKGWFKGAEANDRTKAAPERTAFHTQHGKRKPA